MASNVKVDKITPTTNCGTVTLGDSGDTISIPTGASLSIGGSVSGIDGIVNWDTTAKTTGFTAVAGTGYFVNTTSGAITVTLPASPTAGDLVAVKDYAFTADTNNITLARNGSNIQGVANDFIINTKGRSVTLIYVDATQGWLLTGASQKTDIITPAYVTATGGTVTTCGDYKIHTFTSPGTFCVSCAGNADGSNTVDYLVVAGGGGTASSGCGGSGGGGGGGYRESSGAASGCYTVSPLGACVSALPVSVTGYPITVGAGGSGGTSPPGCASQGSNSIFSTVTSAGGGASKRSPTGGSGGSGGGGSPAPLSGGAGNTPPVSPPQGNPGGTGLRYGPGPSTRGYAGGGGGGATATGANAAPDNYAGNGGNGATSCITGSPVARAGGGGAGSGREPSGPTVPAGTGGSGGGGNGGQNAASGSAGSTNTGGGAGGSGYLGPTCYAGAAGGSGVVIIRYKYQ